MGRDSFCPLYILFTSDQSHVLSLVARYQDTVDTIVSVNSLSTGDESRVRTYICQEPDVSVSSNVSASGGERLMRLFGYEASHLNKDFRASSI